MDLTASVQSSNMLTCPQRVREKIASDIRRDHAASPCLSTAIDNRELPPTTNGWTARFVLGSLFRPSPRPRERVAARCVVLYQTAANASKRAAGSFSQRRENRSDNFFTFVTRSKQIVRFSAHDDA
jgi:hypothetical protein